MATAFVKHGRLSGQLLLRRIGWPMLVTVALIIVSAIVHAVLIPAARQRTAESRQAITQFRQNSAESKQGQLLNARNQQFRDRLGPVGERSESLKVLFAEAAAQGLTLSQADYHLLVDEDGGYQKLQITLPLKGAYPKVRSFVDAVLQKLPAASLDEMSFHRSSVKNPNVEARLKFTLYLKEGR